MLTFDIIFRDNYAVACYPTNLSLPCHIIVPQGVKVSHYSIFKGLSPRWFCCLVWLLASKTNPAVTPAQASGGGRWVMPDLSLPPLLLHSSPVLTCHVFVMPWSGVRVLVKAAVNHCTAVFPLKSGCLLIFCFSGEFIHLGFFKLYLQNAAWKFWFLS